MPKDFAKKKQRRNNSGASRQSKKQSTPPVLWFLAFLLVAAFVSALFYLKSDNSVASSKNSNIKSVDSTKTTPPNSGQKSEKPKEIKSQPKAVVIHNNEIDNENDIPLYDLHEDLTNKEVIISKEDLTLPDNINRYTYTMPCGSFRESSRAEQLKAQIAMTGNNSSIAAVQYKQETWYRVQLGPFNKKRTAESIRHRLQDNNINGCIITPHLIK